MESKNRNEGFSLVELIIVIAIMAILVALLAPQYIKYVEKSKITTDSELISDIHDVIGVAITDENIEHRPLNGIPITTLDNMDPTNQYPDFMAQIQNDLGGASLSTIKDRLQSRNFKGQPIMVEITSLQQVTVTVTSSDGLSSIQW